MKSAFEEMMKGLDEVESYLAGETEGFKAHVPREVDVKSIRKSLRMTQVRFSDVFGFSLDAVKHWEAHRRTPESSARALLTVISSNPRAVIHALHPETKNVAARKYGVKPSRLSKKVVASAGTGKTSRASRARA